MECDDPVAMYAKISQTAANRLRSMQEGDGASASPIIRRLLLALFKGRTDEEIMTTIMESYNRSNVKAS